MVLYTLKHRPTHLEAGPDAGILELLLLDLRLDSTRVLVHCLLLACDASNKRRMLLRIGNTSTLRLPKM
jgi:hypothetical protein